MIISTCKILYNIFNYHRVVGSVNIFLYTKRKLARLQLLSHDVNIYICLYMCVHQCQLYIQKRSEYISTLFDTVYCTVASIAIVLSSKPYCVFAIDEDTVYVRVCVVRVRHSVSTSGDKRLHQLQLKYSLTKRIMPVIEVPIRYKLV